ncbi:MAG: hypothetical protein HOY79_15970 [Streptomyces sp.]|nr:hypothetical protein [Streptomyces sp.]
MRSQNLAARQPSFSASEDFRRQCADRQVRECVCGVKQIRHAVVAC